MATAGDVNGDGYADLIVGATYYDNGQANEGRTYVFLGSAVGLSPTAVWRAESDQSYAYFGASARAAGDVNGDGYADVIVGAYYYDNNQTNEGRAYVYYGNGGTGRLVLARQAQDSGTPLQPWGLSESAEGFELRMWATDPMGRGRVKLQTQACPVGEPFSAATCITQTATTWTDVTPTAAGINLTQSISGLTADTLYRWRARVLYAPQTVTEAGITAPPRPAHGPWRRFLGQALEADLRTLEGTVFYIYLPLVLKGD